MAIGPGKYDDLCSYVRDQAGVTDKVGGGVMVIVIGGHRGNGFSCQADLETTLTLADLLEEVAGLIRSDLAMTFKRMQ